MTLPRGRPRTSTKALEPRSTLASTPPGASAAAPIIVDDVEDLLSAASDERDNVWLWRRGGGRWDFLAPLTPLELRELGIRVTVQQRFGGGQFKARLRERGGKWGVSREFSIEGEPKTPARDETPAAGAIAASSSSGSSPAWVNQIVIPIATTLGTALAAALAKKMFETPTIDPLLAKLVDRMGRGEGVNPLELQRLLLDAETRGENRGRELGELTAAVDAPRGGGESSGVAGAISQAVPVLNRMLDIATTNRRGRRGAVAHAAPALPASTTSDTTTSSSGAAVPDIVPSWLRPFIGYKGLLINVADRGKNAGQYADMIMDQLEDDEQLLTAVVEANAAGRLFSDLVAAIPEITGKPERERFAAELVTAIQESLKEMTLEDAPAETAEAPAAETAHA